MWLIKTAQRLLKTNPVCSLPQMEDQGAQVVNRPPGKVQEDLDPTQESPGESNENKTEDNTNAGGYGWSDPVDHGFPGDYIPPDPYDLEDPVDPVGEDSDDEDPWKPLNPHEPGNLKIRPYRRGTGSYCFWTYLLY